MSVHDEITESSDMTRGRFLDLMLGGVAGLAALGGAGAVLGYLSPPQDRMLGGGEPLVVAEESEIPVNSGRVVAYGSEKVVVVHAETGFVALSAVCTHAGCLVMWDPEAKRIHCPCHDGVFDLSGNVVSGPPPEALKVFRAEVQGGRVMVSSA